MQTAGPPESCKAPQPNFDLYRPNSTLNFWQTFLRTILPHQQPSTLWLLRCAGSCYAPIRRNVAYDQVLFLVNCAVAAYVQPIRDVFISQHQDGKPTKTRLRRPKNPLPSLANDQQGRKSRQYPHPRTLQPRRKRLKKTRLNKLWSIRCWKQAIWIPRSASLELMLARCLSRREKN